MNHIRRITSRLAGHSRSLAKDSRGMTTVEYCVILGVVVVFGITVWSSFGEQVNERITANTGAIQGMQGATAP